MGTREKIADALHNRLHPTHIVAVDDPEREDSHLIEAPMGAVTEAVMEVVEEEIGRLAALTSECACNHIDVDGPSIECPVHGAVRGLHEAQARVRELEEENQKLRHELAVARGETVGPSWAEYVQAERERKAREAELQPKPRLTLEQARQLAAEHARARQLKEEKS